MSVLPVTSLDVDDVGFDVFGLIGGDVGHAWEIVVLPSGGRVAFSHRDGEAVVFGGVAVEEMLGGWRVVK